MPRHGKPVESLQSTFLIRDDNGNPYRIAVVISDITERKQAEEALRQSHDELRALYEGMSDGLLIADLDTKRLLSDKSCDLPDARILGNGTAFDDGYRYHRAEDVRAILKRFDERVAGWRPSTAASSVERKDGTVLPVEIVSNTHTLPWTAPASLVSSVTSQNVRRHNKPLRRNAARSSTCCVPANHERQVIAYDIHDGLAQQLAGAIMQFEVFDHLKEAKPKQATDAYQPGLTLLRQGHAEARSSISGVPTANLDETGLVLLLATSSNDRCFKGQPHIVFHSSVEFNRLTPILENVIYRVVQRASPTQSATAKAKWCVSPCDNEARAGPHRDSRLGRGLRSTDSARASLWAGGYSRTGTPTGR